MTRRINDRRRNKVKTMTFGAQVTHNQRISNKDSITHGIKTKKSPRFRNERSMKSKEVYSETSTTALGMGISLSDNVSRRRRTVQNQLKYDATDNIPYAGAKFSSPPPPSVLPKPPSHWITSPIIHHFDVDVATAMSQHLRMLLRVES